MAGLSILKHTFDLSDEVLCERWLEKPYYQFFCGEEFFQHRLVFDRSSLTRWRQRMGGKKPQALLQESLSVATKTEAIKPSDLNHVIIDITVQPKNVMFPTDAGNVDLLNEFALGRMLSLARRLLDQKQHQRGPKVYSLHAPELECIVRARRTGLTSSGSRSRSPPRRRTPAAVSSSPM